MWLCRCECGNTKELKSILIRRGISRSCGCLASEVTTKRSTKHGHSPMYGRISPTYHSWAGMKARCTNPKNGHYALYGGRGITVCERWTSFAGFLADMGEKPGGMTLDRIDNDGSYCPENCRWATNSQQANNKNCNRMMCLNGTTQTMQQWVEQLGLIQSTVSWRVQRGWSDRQSLLGRGNAHTS